MKRLSFVSAFLFSCVTLTAQTSSSSIYVRLYAGANPFRNDQWNNWDVGIAGQTNISSGFLNYADGSPSNISAVLSSTAAVADNGAAYAKSATICPDTVLRYASYTTSTRTLTINGLDNEGKYYVEFYASRERSDGQVTQFIIGSQTASVPTDNNSSSVALFSAIAPTNGSITVSLKRVKIYNYLNGFKISKAPVTVSGAKNKRIGLLGSSTAAGYFNSLWPADSSYAHKLLHYYQQAGIADTLYNLAANGANIYNAMPNLYSAGDTLQPVGMYASDRNRNITKVLGLHPDVILCHYPTNNYDILTVPQVMFAMRTIKATADSAGVPLFFVGTQPRGSLTLAGHQKLIEINDSLKVEFGSMAISYYDSVAAAPRSINMNPSLWLSNDSIHMNPDGHSILFRQIKNANIFSAASGIFAGPNQFIRLPLTSVLLNGAITSMNNAVRSINWRKVSGPGIPLIQSPGSLKTLVSGLAPGTYVFELSGINSDGNPVSSTLQVTVLSFAPPIVSAGENQTILLPARSVTLSGEVSSNGGGRVVSTIWSQRSGPNNALIVSPESIHTQVNGLVSGIYVFGLTVTDNLGNSSYDSAVITVTEGLPVNVRLYGGADPFRNSQWNNWNVGAAAVQGPVTSGLFNYADGSSSNISAILSIHAGLYDNGANYSENATICPDTVLRFVSYMTSTRTLTIKGLDSASKYYLELYGSRNIRSGQGTRYSVGNQTITISTDTNSTKVAVFSPITPAKGSIVVSISRSSVYNYINGFKIVKLLTGPAAMSSDAVPGTILGNEEEENGDEIQTYPNPVSNNLTIVNKRGNLLHVGVFDITGRKLIQAREYNYTNQIDLSRLKKGCYILLVTDESTGQTDRKIIVKL